MRYRVYLTGQNDCIAFCNAVNQLKGRIELVDGSGRYRINARSVLGCLMASAEWGNKIYIETDPENDCYFALQNWIEEAADDAANIHN